MVGQSLDSAHDAAGLPCSVGALPIHWGNSVGGPSVDASRSRTSGAWAIGCPARGVPSVASVAPGRLSALREGLRRVVLLEEMPRRLYSLGVITSENAWTDNYPQRNATMLAESAHVPAAYEMRWWIARADLVADVFVFIGLAGRVISLDAPLVPTAARKVQASRHPPRRVRMISCGAIPTASSRRTCICSVAPACTASPPYASNRG